MLTITPRAAERLREVQSAEGRADQALRIRVQAGGCNGLSYDMDWHPSGATTDADHFVELGDGMRLVVDAASLPFLDNVQIDYAESLYGGGFKFENPKATGGCGCGQSFSV
jgi:iron-sulfur cluster assembly accessory protein